MQNAEAARPRVSLVTTVLNEAATLPTLLRSIDEQTLAPDEIVVVDGGSTDCTLEILQSWSVTRPTVRVLAVPGANIAQGRNRAIQEATGSLIAVTDAGVELAPTWLEELVLALERDPAVDIASGFFVAAPQSTFEAALGATTLPNSSEIDAASFLPSSRSVAFRRSAWEFVGGYPEWLDYCEDLVFDFALRGAGLRFTWVPEAIVEFRPRPSLTSFARQYFFYARGDGRADLWRLRHAIRYGTYLLGLPALSAGRPGWARAAIGLALAAVYLKRPVQRLVSAHRGTAGPFDSVLLAELALVPLIRFTGDVAKMVGYPVGVAWRLSARRPVTP